MASRLLQVVFEGVGWRPLRHLTMLLRTWTKRGEHGGGAFLPLLSPPACLCRRMGNVEAPDLCTVKAKRKAKWPPQGQATEDKRGPDWLPWNDGKRHTREAGMC